MWRIVQSPPSDATSGGGGTSRGPMHGNVDVVVRAVKRHEPSVSSRRTISNASAYRAARSRAVG